MKYQLPPCMINASVRCCRAGHGWRASTCAIRTSPPIHFSFPLLRRWRNHLRVHVPALRAQRSIPGLHVRSAKGGAFARSGCERFGYSRRQQGTTTLLLHERGLLRPTPSDVLLWTDASFFGWGFHDAHGQVRQGRWPPGREANINVLELRVVLLAMRSDLVCDTANE